MANQEPLQSQLVGKEGFVKQQYGWLDHLHNQVIIQFCKSKIIILAQKCINFTISTQLCY